MNTYTVIGYWNDSDRRIVTGVIEGSHDVHGGWAAPFQPFAEHVEAESVGDAEDQVHLTNVSENFS